jgi:hypothetical protein
MRAVTKLVAASDASLKGFVAFVATIHPCRNDTLIDKLLISTSCRKEIDYIHGISTQDWNPRPKPGRCRRLIG